MYMWWRCTRSLVLPGGVALAWPCSAGLADPSYSTHEDTRDVMGSYWIVFPNLSLTSLKTFPVQILISWYRWFFTSIKQQKEEEILSSSEVELVEMFYYQFLFLLKYAFTAKKFFQYDYIFAFSSICCASKAHWTFFLPLIPCNFSQLQTHCYLFQWRSFVEKLKC